LAKLSKLIQSFRFSGGALLIRVFTFSFRSIVQTNLTEILEAEPKRLRREIFRLRAEKVKLRKAETTLRQYRENIEETQAKIAYIEKVVFYFVPTKRLVILNLIFSLGKSSFPQNTGRKASKYSRADCARARKYS